MIVATHAKKARYDLGTCPLCRALMTTGQQVCRVGRGGSWLHVRCFLQKYRAADLGTP